jgi:hypothetical protein
VISKIITGKSLRGLALYLLGNEKDGPREGAVLLGTSFAGTTAKAFSRQFAAIRRLKPTVNRAVKHVALSLSPEDRKLTDDELIELARRWKEGMGYPDDADWILVRHNDTAHFQHAHLVLSRITAKGEVVTEAHERHRSRKLTEQLEREFGLIPAVKSDNNKEKNMDNSNDKQQRRQEAIEARLDELAGEAEIALATGYVASIEPPSSVNVKTRRDYKRDLLEDEYEKALSELFATQVRYVRKLQRSITLHFNDGSRIEDKGDRVTSHGKASAADIAARFVELALAHNWPGIVVKGDDDVIVETYKLALARGLAVSCIDAHQLHLFNIAKGSGTPPAGSGTPTSPPSPPQQPADPLQGLTGPGGIGQRLRDMQDEASGNRGSQPRKFPTNRLPK